MQFETHIAGLKLEHPLMNAAGTCKLLDGNEGVRKLAQSNTAAICLRSGACFLCMGRILDKREEKV